MENEPATNSWLKEQISTDKWIDHISDKYGVSRQRIQLLMNAFEKDPETIEAILQRERFVR